MPELALGLKDKYAGLRRLTIEKLPESKIIVDADMLKTIESIANTDEDKKTKAAAISFLAAKGDEKYSVLFTRNIDDSSYSVAGASLAGLAKSDAGKAYTLAKNQSIDAKGALADEVNKILMTNGTEDDYDFIAGTYNEAVFTLEKLDATESFCKYLEKINDVSKIKKGVGYVLKYRQRIPNAYKIYTESAFKYWLGKLSKAKGGEVAKYISDEFK